MKKWIFNLFSSNIKIRVSGKNINNFIKRLIKNNINIIKLIPINYKEVDIIINYNDIDKIKHLKSVYDVKITNTYGYLRILKIIKKNLIIISFLIFGIICIYILYNMVFDSEVIHSNNKIISLVEDELYNHGIKKYSFMKKYNEVEEIKNEILEDNKDKLEWMEIIREGTKYIVRVEERIINKEEKDLYKYNVVAGKNAVIKSINAISGEKVKNIDTYVKKGDIIISGNIILPNNEKIFGSASGKVIGEVWYNVDIEYPYYYHEIKYTGKKKKVLVFNFLNKRISFFDFKKYKSFEKDIKYLFKDNTNLLSFTYEYQYETIVIDKVYTKEKAKEAANELVKKKLLEKYNKIEEITNIIVINEDYLRNKIRLSLFITCNEDITKYEKIIEE